MKPYFLFILLSLVTLACNPVKRVLKSDTMTQQVVDSFIKKHPVKNDTITSYITGKTDTVIQHQSFRDTIKGDAVPCDSFTRVTEKGTKVTVDKKGKLTIENDSIKVFVPIRVDTLNTLIKDRTLLFEAQQLVRKQDAIINGLKDVIATQGKEADQLRKDLFWTRVKMYSLLVLLLLLGSWILIKRFQSFFL
jgi:hypothetical protein